MSPDQVSTSLAPSPQATPSVASHASTDESLTLEIRQLLDELVVHPSAAPGASAALARRVGGVWRWAVGAAGTTDPFNREPITPDTWFDLASITKSLTALGVARAVDRRQLAWEGRLHEYLPVVHGTFGGEASLLSLLSHRAGLEAHATVRDRSLESLRSLAQTRRDDLALDTGGSALEPYAPVYSDIGYMLVGLALERGTQRELDEYVATELEALARGTATGVPNWEKLLASARQLTQRGVPVSQVAPTEVLATRGGLVRGRVHDDNAWTLSETRLSGHAGTFGTALGVLGLGVALMELCAGRSSAVSGQSLGALMSPRSNGSLRAGFDSKNVTGPSVVGSVLGPRTFGHLGFTGTSYWCDPDSETVVVLLTNRVCPTRDNVQLRAIRPLAHDRLATLAATLDPHAAPLR